MGQFIGFTATVNDTFGNQAMETIDGLHVALDHVTR